MAVHIIPCYAHLRSFETQRDTEMFCSLLAVQSGVKAHRVARLSKITELAWLNLPGPLGCGYALAASTEHGSLCVVETLSKLGQRSQVQRLKPVERLVHSPLNQVNYRISRRIDGLTTKTCLDVSWHVIICKASGVSVYRERGIWLNLKVMIEWNQPLLLRMLGKRNSSSLLAMASSLVELFKSSSCQECCAVAVKFEAWPSFWDLEPTVMMLVNARHVLWYQACSPLSVR